MPSSACSYRAPLPRLHGLAALTLARARLYGFASLPGQVNRLSVLITFHRRRDLRSWPEIQTNLDWVWP